MAKSALHENAMLVQLTIRSWSARKHDRGVTAEVARTKDAAADAGRYNKRLLPKQALEFIQQSATAARSEHYKRTLPWSDEGPRILSVTGFQDYQQEMIRLRREFESAADSFAERYDEYVHSAKVELGKLYDPADYPDNRTIRSKFAIEMNILPLPDGDDLRVSLPQADIDKLREDIRENVQAAVAKGQKDVFHRVHEVVSHMVEKLTNYKPHAATKREKGYFRDSLVTNVRELCELIPSLNVTGDKAIDEVLKDLKNVCDVEPNDLRKHDKLRSNVASEAQDILNRVKGYM